MRLYIPLRHDEYEALERLSQAQRRRPRDQAAMILAQVLASETQRLETVHAREMRDESAGEVKEDGYVPA